MKALIINSQGGTDEAFTLAKVAIKNNMKSHVCWHVYGLLWRSVKNFDEAIKAYKFALKLAPESTQIQKDLALLQIQMRDYQGYTQSRRSMLQQKTLLRQNWTALAVAQHLSGDLADAERTLTTYEEIIKKPPPKSDIEHHEAILYKNTIIAEMGETERALDHLNAATKQNPDRGAVMELRAQYLLQLERRIYYDGLISALAIDDADHKALKSLYDEFVEKDPRADAPRRIPLDFLTGEEFEKAADVYLQRMLRKGVPSTFANVKSLYVDPAKQEAIEKLVEGYLEGKGVHEMNGSAESKDQKDHFPTSVRYFLAQHYNYYRSRNLDKALKLVQEAIESDEKSVDCYMTKARILKHHGDLQAAADTMEKARTLDERDRYINTKAAKYRLRNNQNDAAIDDMSKFTRNEATGGPLGDLHDMQCQWYIYEDGLAYLRQGKLGLALKRFTTIINIFEIWHEDQFDFHSFSLRKGQVRAYIDMIKWEDGLREHPYFTRAAIQVAKIYVRLHDRPELAHDDVNGINGAGLSSAERKRAQKKARKEAEKQAQLEAEKKDAKKTAGVDSNGEAKKEDQDPKGEKLLQTSEPLVEATKLVDQILEFSPKAIGVQQIAFEVFLRRSESYNVSLRVVHPTDSIREIPFGAACPQSHRFHRSIQSYRPLSDHCSSPRSKPNTFLYTFGALRLQNPCIGPRSATPSINQVGQTQR